MDKRKEIKEDLESTITSDISEVGLGAQSTIEEESGTLKFVSGEVELLHKINTDLLEEEGKQLLNKKIAKETRILEQKGTLDIRRIELENQKLESELRAKEKEEAKKNSFWYKVGNIACKVGKGLLEVGKVAAPVIASIVGVKAVRDTIKAEQGTREHDAIIVPKPAKDLSIKMTKF